MTQPEHNVRDLHLSTRPPSGDVVSDMPDDYRDHGGIGWKQLVCAWFIVLAFAMVFKVADFISANRTAPFARATDLARMADFDRSNEIERWERGETREWTMTIPSARTEMLASRADQ